jgi:hypothetical protein
MLDLLLSCPDDRTADLLRDLAEHMGCTVSEPLPVLPADPEADARVEAWLAEQHPRREDACALPGGLEEGA